MEQPIESMTATGSGLVPNDYEVEVTHSNLDTEIPISSIHTFEDLGLWVSFDVTEASVQFGVPA